MVDRQFVLGVIVFALAWVKVLVILYLLTNYENFLSRKISPRNVGLSLLIALMIYFLIL